MSDQAVGPAIRWAPILAMVRQQFGMAPWESQALRMISPKVSDTLVRTFEAAVLSAVAGALPANRATSTVAFDRLVEAMELLRIALEDDE